MNSLTQAQLKDLDKIVEIDKSVIGHNGRKDMLKKSIESESCLISMQENEIAGFLTYNTNFFGYSFIELVIVSPQERRKGHATALLQHFVKIASTEKIFSSTNQSNTRMQEVFERNGFTRSGIIENLDEGDPELIYFKLK
ncbi:GNAT family N-acetyltransferase [Alkalicella caledoniensis]|uniref:GNAT family N-acetyltransferase n=1 Tax=Alkalicella caledoniensis TaxID=2731377 RepID=A0A7G9WB05_ALKCA|nr:GNAT family N-acetyltransferase [Alkalicella caledoniensis]QNO15867.1 GNAT family N-acetyltransferase [Alkalicella caledoniensis]